MSGYWPSKNDLAELFHLASPIVTIQLGLMAMGVVDTLMVGQVSALALGAVALGNMYTIGWSVFGMGVLMALDPLISQALGAGDEEAVRRAMQRGLLIAVILTIPTTVAYLFVEPVLRLVQQPDELVPFAAGYVYRTAGSLLPFYAFIVLRQSLQAHRCTGPIVVTIVVANIFNAILNYAWIFGHFGFPELGLFGSAWATLCSRFFMTALMLALGWRFLHIYLNHWTMRVFRLTPIRRMLAVGLPIGGQMMLEWGAFGAIALLMGWLGVEFVAAHQIALNLASITFMVPLGISSAAAVIVGHALGRGDYAAMRRSTTAALFISIVFMSCSAVAFIVAPMWWSAFFTTSESVLMIAAVLLPIAGVFQVFDGIQVVALGILRGLGDTKVPVISAILGFWLIGLPAGLWLAFQAQLGAEGLWWGAAIGLAVVAVFLILRLKTLSGVRLARLMID